ncbi:endonuclease domain-containing protein [Arthrobacter sp. NPDC097144]|uniref:endonuclease domain-containing protein n=1 Tax=Arthrobacter sp. NPDC097144 TaxID=3363946 RepID=UPI0037F39266
MSGDIYDVLLKVQGGGCAICGMLAKAKGYNLSVDHDHSCCPGEMSCGNCIRGILCPDCNRAIGLFRDDTRIMTAAIAYLRRGHLPMIE